MAFESQDLAWPKVIKSLSKAVLRLSFRRQRVGFAICHSGNARKLEGPKYRSRAGVGGEDGARRRSCCCFSRSSFVRSFGLVFLCSAICIAAAAAISGARAVKKANSNLRKMHA